MSKEQWARFKFSEGDIRQFDTCQKACAGVDYVLHEAALGSVPRSIADPIATNETNISGFLNMLTAARDAEVKALPMQPAVQPMGIILHCRKWKKTLAIRFHLML